MSDVQTLTDPDDPNTTWDPRDPMLPAKLKAQAAVILSTSGSTSDESPAAGATFPPRST
jgi:hypothetical protein